jgi:hypothetical protein
VICGLELYTQITNYNLLRLSDGLKAIAILEMPLGMHRWGNFNQPSQSLKSNKSQKS